MANSPWSEDVNRAIDLLAQLPQIRYAFVPGFDRNPEGNSHPAARFVRENGELCLVSAFQQTPVPLRNVFDGYTLSIVTDGNGYKCVQGINEQTGDIREIAPALRAYYHSEDTAARRLIDENFVPEGFDGALRTASWSQKERSTVRVRAPSSFVRKPER